MPKTAHDGQGFRYYIHDGAASFRFELLGTLAGKDVVELERCWKTASSTLGARAFLVDLDELRALDECGWELLCGWHEQGANLIAASARARLLVESITGHALP